MMTMGDDALFASLALPVVVGPILEKLEERDRGAARTLRTAFYKKWCNIHVLAMSLALNPAMMQAWSKQIAFIHFRGGVCHGDVSFIAMSVVQSNGLTVEAQNPGFTYDLINGILAKAEIQDRVDMTECLLRLEGMNSSTEFQILRPEEPLQILNERSYSLKKILSRIPDEISDRKRFLETIKDIASAIRLLLDSVNNVFPYIDGPQYKQAVEVRKREFVRYSRNFSNTLKEFFKYNEKQFVFLSANHLVNQTNLLMKTVKEALD